MPDKEACEAARAMLTTMTQLESEIAMLRTLLKDIYDWSGKDCPHWQRIEDALNDA